MVTLVELIKRKDGTVAAYGNSIEVDQEEAQKLVAAGSHRDLSNPLEPIKVATNENKIKLESPAKELKEIKK